MIWKKDSSTKLTEIVFLVILTFSIWEETKEKSCNEKKLKNSHKNLLQNLIIDSSAAVDE